MFKLTNKNYRAIAKQQCKIVNLAMQNISDKKIYLSDIDDIMLFIRQNSIETSKEIKSKFADELSIASIGVACTGCLALTLSSSDSEEELFPKEWLTPSGVNANVFLAAMLNQVSNHALAVYTLIDKGLRNQARGQLRLLIELSWLVIALIHDRELWKGYVQNSFDEKKEKKFWAKNLKPFQLSNRVTRLEESLGLPKEMMDEFKATRRSIYDAYSGIIHNSYSAIIDGAYGYNEDDSTHTFGVFGEADSEIHGVASHLNFVLVYFTLSFFAVMDKVHNFHPTSPGQDFWFESFVLNKTLLEAFIFNNSKTF